VVVAAAATMILLTTVTRAVTIALVDMVIQEEMEEGEIERQGPPRGSYYESINSTSIS
jgi:hypothetical protein